ncbi:MAG TPA: hypothetical protein VHH92_03525 [Actinomycetota bacterium]|nr:hypothetical protein [Actinomycetota bacterium]
MVIRRTLFSAVVVMAACSPEAEFAAPESLDHEVWVKVDRRVENELMRRAASTLAELGLTRSFAAAYEFLPNKPQIFAGAGRGASDRQAVMDAVLPLFGGDLGPTEAPQEVRNAGLSLLCAPYSHTGVPGTIGTGGLASISAICTWSEAEATGFVVGVAGPSVDDVAHLTTEFHTAVT